MKWLKKKKQQDLSKVNDGENPFYDTHYNDLIKDESVLPEENKGFFGYQTKEQQEENKKNLDTRLSTSRTIDDLRKIDNQNTSLEQVKHSKALLRNFLQGAVVIISDELRHEITLADDANLRETYPVSAINPDDEMLRKGVERLREYERQCYVEQKPTEELGKLDPDVEYLRDNAKEKVIRI